MTWLPGSRSTFFSSKDEALFEMSSSPFHHNHTNIHTHRAPPCGSPPQLVQVLES